MGAKMPQRPVVLAMTQLGEDLTTWRKLRGLTAAEVAGRANVTRQTISRVESGKDVSVETLLRVAKALGVLESLASSVNPYATDVGRMRMEEALPKRVRRRKTL